MAASDPPNSDKESHVSRQSKYFDSCVEYFCQPIPQVIRVRTFAIAESAGLGGDSRVLDVGTGAGALIGHFLKLGVKAENVVGLDLSPEMLSSARARFPDIFFYQADVADLDLPLPENFPSHIYSFDVVFFNACFGNMFDQQEALAAAVRLLTNKGRVVISQPLGARFVASLNRNEPHIVPHQLPGENEFADLCLGLELNLVRFESRDDFYLAVLQKN